jgi:hypothetical protein
MGLGMAGGAKDDRGTVRVSMVGVKVEAASPALIEGSRTVNTNGEGR